MECLILWDMDRRLGGRSGLAEASDLFLLLQWMRTFPEWAIFVLFSGALMSFEYDASLSNFREN